MYFYAIEISVYFVYIIRSASYIASKQVMQHWYIISNYLYSNMLSHWYLHLIAFFFFLHYSWVASYRNFLVNYLYFSSVYFFTIEQNIFFTLKHNVIFCLHVHVILFPKIFVQHIFINFMIFINITEFLWCVCNNFQN